MKRVYHPVADNYQDVPDDATQEWKEAGWLLTRPSHVAKPDVPVGAPVYSPPAVVDITSAAPQPAPVDLTPDGTVDPPEVVA